MSVFSFSLPIPTPSLNVVNGWHWSKRHKWTQQIQMIVRMEARRLGWDGSGKAIKRLVTVTRFSAGRLDTDNFIGGCKGLVDALVRAGVLVDDSPDWVTVDYVQAKSKRDEAGTQVEVVEI